MSWPGRGLLRKQVFEGPMHEHPGDVPEMAGRTLRSAMPTEDRIRMVPEEASDRPGPASDGKIHRHEDQVRKLAKAAKALLRAVAKLGLPY